MSGVQGDGAAWELEGRRCDAVEVRDCEAAPTSPAVLPIPTTKHSGRRRGPARETEQETKRASKTKSEKEIENDHLSKGSTPTLLSAHVQCVA